MRKLIISQLPLLLIGVASLAEELPCRNPKPYIVQDHVTKSTYAHCKRNGMTWWYNDKGGIKSKVNFKNGKTSLYLFLI